MVAGFGDQVGYDALVAALTGGHIDKAHRFSDWSARPLSPAQITYAAADVTYLRRVYRACGARLEQDGRLEWVRRGDGRPGRARHLPRRPGDDVGAAAPAHQQPPHARACCGPSPPGASARRSGSTSPASACSRTRACSRSPPPRPTRRRRWPAPAASRRGFAEGRTGRRAARGDRRGARRCPRASCRRPRAAGTARAPSPALVSLLKVLLAAQVRAAPRRAQAAGQLRGHRPAGGRGRARTSRSCTAGAGGVRRGRAGAEAGQDRARRGRQADQAAACRLVPVSLGFDPARYL